MVTIFAVLDFDERFIPDPMDRKEITLQTKTGFGMLLYTWITSFIWPCVLWRLVTSSKMINEEMFNLNAEL